MTHMHRISIVANVGDILDSIKAHPAFCREQGSARDDAEDRRVDQM